MASPTSTPVCPDCQSELPAASRFCPSCGARTPQYTVAATGQIARGQPVLSEEAAHRARLQRALGSAWEITRLIGRGGFAEVYAALDVNLRREVAVKTLRHDIELSPQMIQRFKREAESVARLRHPNIVPIYQVGEGEGLVYFMMPVIEGESLATAIVRGESFSIAETCRVLREVAGALGAAHRTGVVHRDVKPDNIMLEGPERRAVVMDFGIAKLADAAEARLTGTGLLIGSPHYMSPEQAAGESELDHRSDEYSLAVVGYQMLAGRMPFDSTSVQSILFKQMTETPPPISELRPDVPPALSAALAKALSKKPEDRFQSMEEFAAALPANDGVAGISSARKPIDMRARVATARQTIAKWGIPAAVATIVGLAATLAVYHETVPDQQLAVVASRPEAMFATRSLVPMAAGATLKTEFVHDDSVYRFIYSAVGSRKIADSLAASLGVWRWAVRAPTVKGLHPSAEIGNDGRVIAVGVSGADSLARPTVSADSARALAVAELRKRSWVPASLTFLGDSVIQTSSATTHLFRWNVPAAPSSPTSALAVHGGSPATHRVQVTVRGDTVRSYRELLALPASAKEPAANEVVHNSAIVLVTLLSAALAVLAFVLMVRRSRTDDLQWKAIIVLTLACGAPSLIYLAIAAAHGEVGGSGAASAFAIVVTFTLCGAVAVVPFVVAESVLSADRPETVSGLVDVARGKLDIPEVATAALIGYPAGLCILALNNAAALMSQMLTGRAAITGAGSLMSEAAPALTPFNSLAYAYLVVMAIAFVIALPLVRRLPAAVAVVLPAALMAVAVCASNNHADARISAVGVTLLFTLVAWRFGVLAGMVTAFVMMSTEGLITLFAASGSSGLMTALVAAVLVLLPAGLGVLASRRLKQRIA